MSGAQGDKVDEDEDLVDVAGGIQDPKKLGSDDDDDSDGDDLDDEGKKNLAPSFKYFLPNIFSVRYGFRKRQ